MSASPPRSPVLRVVSPDELLAQEQEADATRVAAEDAANASRVWTTNLASFIDGEFERFQRHRDGANGWSDRITSAMRMFNGVYEVDKLQAIRRFGGSEVYARIVATKCRGASSLLRDVYLNTEKPWGIEPTPDPTMPDDVIAAIMGLVQSEVEGAMSGGQMIMPEQIRERVNALYVAAKRGQLAKARKEAEAAQTKLDDILVEGRFYEALAEFLVDLPLFPFACIKGPVVRITPLVQWTKGRAVIENVPKMFWYRVSPFDLWWTPGVSDISHAAVIELSRLTRADLQQILGLPGYNEAAVRQVLQDYSRSGYVESATAASTTDRAALESREDPNMNESAMLDMLEYHGYVPCVLLREWGLPEEQCPDPDRDYFVDAFKIGRYVIKCQLSYSVKKRPPYYITSFEKVPGTVVGNALPDILADLADVANAALRSLVNNMAIASGPQVVIDDERIAPNIDSDQLEPWKRWHVVNDPMNNSTQEPVKFFSPASNAQELLGVYKEINNIADDLSAIPKYITGSDRLGGAGRTASGLAMLMGNASKILQTVAANVDRDVVYNVISELYDLIMLTDQTGMLRGDESIKVLGVTVAMQRETQRQRQIEFLSATMNPVDVQIMGPKGRATVLRAVSDGIGLAGEDIVPPPDALPAQMPPQGPPGAPAIGNGTGGGPSAMPPGGPAQPQQMQTNTVQ